MPNVLKVLIVDDNLQLLRSSARLIRALGHEVRTAPDPVEAMDMMGSYTPDIILSDYDMPNMSGAEFCSRIRKLGVGVPFYIVSGEDRETQAGECGATEALLKPLTRETLDRILRK